MMRGLRTQGLKVGSAFRANGATLADAPYLKLLQREVEILCPESHWQMNALNPSQGVWNFSGLTQTLDFAEQTGQKVRGHALVYHNALPTWLTGGTWTTQELSSHCQAHIENTVAAGLGRVAYWDVVNELWHSATGAMKSSILLSGLGANYPTQFFQWANAADPNCHLVLNGNEWTTLGPGLTAGTAAIAAWLDQGVPIHGVGTQLHLKLDVVESFGPDAVAQQLEPAIQALANLGVAVHVTELDIAIHEPVTPAKLKSQAYYYGEVVKLCIRMPSVFTLGFWGLTDKYSWVTDDYPGYENHDQPLLFDANLNPKPAYYAVEKALGRRTARPSSSRPGGG